ncbi:1,2-phenylacetyl-CoA epoxidase subunit PaaD [Dactylosporangium sp. CA-092794]|uniref:1,2-phenylacetyl-CoA epoxidase subunit PaaD n=1 Tax=Dactylosporangium sp. CA-092794 TaxID=3239929 RepID=UPI003D8C002B
MVSATAWSVAAGTPDPELPMVSIAELGILRSVEQEGDAVVATITPTYSGCPAMREITADLRHRLAAAGYPNVTVRTRLAPAWTSDWITDAGARKLRAAGIAPPHAAPRRTGPTPLTLLATRTVVTCPRCGSAETARTAQFGSTACKALYRCAACAEPFEYVKEI